MKISVSEADLKYIERARRYLNFLQRWRWAIIVFCACMIGVIAWLFSAIVQVVNWMNNFGGAMAGFAVGASLGVSMAFKFTLLVISLVHAFRPDKSARLMLRFYDALQSEDAISLSCENKRPV